jgi:glutamate-ammonia-ligase adenylyltransferase
VQSVGGIIERVLQTPASFQKKFMNSSSGNTFEALLQRADAGTYEEAFRRLLFRDPKKASMLWEKLLPADHTPAARRVGTLVEELLACPDRDMGLVNLSRFAESTLSPAHFLDSIYLERPLCRLLVILFSCSHYLTDILIRNPGYLSWLIEGGVLETPKSYSDYFAELVDQTAPFEDHRRRLNSIKRYKRRELLRIGSRDLLGLAGVEEVTAELSLMTDAIVEMVLRLALDAASPAGALREDRGSPFAERAPCRRFAVISMGKLGGYELNYSSDIDLIFVCDATGKDDESSFYSALARCITSDLSSPTEEGALYRVDLRLRPDGESGPLVVTLNDHMNYLQSRAMPWEKQALLKARFSAGDAATADDFLENCERVLFGSVGGMEDISQIHTMRERAVRNLPPQEQGSNIKLMLGGIRDIEFIAQALELVHGRRRRDVRSRNTLETLARMYHFGLLDEQAWTNLSDGYRLFRTVEHRLQMLLNVRTHTIPTDEIDLTALGARVARSALARITEDNFRTELGRAIGTVRELFASFFMERRSGDIPLVLSLPPRARDVERIMRHYGISGGEQAHRHLSSLVYGEFPNLEGPETLQSAGRSLPVVLEGIAGTPFPSLTLKNLVAIVKATGAVRSTLELLAGPGDLLRLLISISSLSTRLTGVISRRIELLDALAEGIPPPSVPPADGPESVSRWYEQMLLHIHCLNVFPGAGPETLGPLLADAAGLAIERLFSLSGGDGSGIALVALGSLASGECHLGSDLDLVAVAGEGCDCPEAARIIRRMIELGSSARVGTLDLRLRSEGEGSPLVQRLEAYRQYFGRRAAFWEFIAYAKCRFLCGQRDVGVAFERLVYEKAGEAVSSRRAVRELRSARNRLESLSVGPWDVKHAPGGLYDIDFMAATARAGAGQSGLSTCLERLERVGLLEGAERQTLDLAHRVYYLVEHAAAHHSLAYPPLPESVAFFDEYLGRLLHSALPGHDAFPERLGGVKRSVREIFNRFLDRFQEKGPR